MAKQKQANLKWSVAGVKLSGVPALVVAPLLSASEKHFHNEGGGGGRGGNYTEQDRHFFSTEPDDSIVFAQGLVPRVVEQMQARGWKVSVTNSDLLIPRGGQIVVKNRDEEANFITEVAADSPDRSILVVVRNSEERKAVYRKLNHQVPCHLVTTAPEEAFRDRGSTLVVSTRLFANVNPYDWDTIVFIGTETITGQDGQQGLKQCLNVYQRGEILNQYRYCLHRGPTLSHLEQLEVEEACGPLLHQDAKEAASEKVSVILLDLPITASKPSRLTSALERKRQSVWNNADRNMWIACLANAIAKTDIDTLSTFEILFDAGGRNVAVVVESPEHARTLNELLPDWKVVTAQRNDDGRVEDEGDEGDDSDEGDKDARGYDNVFASAHNRWIVTEMYAAEHALDVEVIINAMGGQYPLKIQHNDTSSTNSGYVLLIDLCVIGDNVPDADAQSRADHYQRSGWKVSFR